MQDDTLYNMTDNTEYQANLFAADLLIEDEEIEDMVQNEDLDYFGLCSSLNATTVTSWKWKLLCWLQMQAVLQQDRLKLIIMH